LPKTNREGIEMTEQVKTTSLEEMKNLAVPVVAIPAWDGESEINVRLKRVSLMSLIQAGQLPNELLAIAYKTMGRAKGEESPAEENDPEHMQKFTMLMHEVAKHALVEPTYDEIVEHAAPLTDQQLLAIFMYCMSGVNALKSFRTAARTLAAIGDSGEDVRG